MNSKTQKHLKKYRKLVSDRNSNSIASQLEHHFQDESSLRNLPCSFGTAVLPLLGQLVLPGALQLYFPLVFP